VLSDLLEPSGDKISYGPTFVPEAKVISNSKWKLEIQKWTYCS
jgi:hypothetical protein